MPYLDIWKACKDGDLDMVRIMVREGQNPDEVTNHEGNTPMHFAARNGHYLVVKYLLDIPASVNLMNKRGFTPRQYLQEAMVDPTKLDKIRRKLESMKNENDKEKVKEKAKMNAFLEKQKLMADTMKLLTMAENGAYQRA
jgi:hypothetical protein